MKHCCLRQKLKLFGSLLHNSKFPSAHLCQLLWG